MESVARHTQDSFASQASSGATEWLSFGFGRGSGVKATPDELGRKTPRGSGEFLKHRVLLQNHFRSGHIFKWKERSSIPQSCVRTLAVEGLSMGTRFPDCSWGPVSQRNRHGIWWQTDSRRRSVGKSCRTVRANPPRGSPRLESPAMKSHRMRRSLDPT